MSSTTADAAYQSATLNPSAQFSQATAQCTLTPYLAYAEPYSNGWTFKHGLELAAGIATILCIVLTAVSIFSHLTVWVRPNEQKQIVRILFFAPVFAVFNFFALWFYNKSWILTPFAELYECFALVAIFYLFVLYVSPDEGNRERFFHHLQRFGRDPQQQGGGSLHWFQVTWVLVFQILPTKLLISIVTWALNAGMCPIKYTDSKASTAVSVVQSIVTVVCVMSIIKFAKRMKKEMEGHHAWAKLITFKGVVGVVLLQTPIFTALAQHQIFHPTKHISIIDFAIGVRCFLVCIEMFIVSLLFLWSFSTKEYKNLANSQRLSRDGVAKGLVDALNITDILKGCFYMCRIISGGGLTRLPANPSGPKDIEGYDSNTETMPPPAAYPAPPYQQQYQQYPQQIHQQTHQQYPPQHHQQQHQQPYQQQQH